MAAYLQLDELVNVKNQMERSQAKYWYVYDSDRSEIACKETDGTIEDSFEELAQVVNSLSGDFVRVTIRKYTPGKDEDGNVKKGGNLRGKWEYLVKLRPLAGKGMNGFGGGGGGMFGMEMLQGLYQNINTLQAQVAALPLQAEIERLKAEIKDKKKDTGFEGLFEKFLDKCFEAYDKEIKPGTVVKPASAASPSARVSGTVSNEKPLTEDEVKIKSAQLGQNLRGMSEVLGPDTYAFMADLAARAKENPELFKMFARASVDKQLNLADLIKNKVA